MKSLQAQFGRPLGVLQRPHTIAEESGMAPQVFKGNSLFTIYAIDDCMVFEIDKYELLHVGMNLIALSADIFIQRLQDFYRELQEVFGWTRCKRNMLSKLVTPPYMPGATLHIRPV